MYETTEMYVPFMFHRFLATGESYRLLGFSYRISGSTIRLIVPEVCQALWRKMKDAYLPIPSTPEDWQLVAQHFEVLWHFPHCLGALDGKHIAIRAPRNTGSLYYNYKGFFSIVLMVLADANYRLLYIDVGSPGRNSDGGVFANCSLGQALRNETLQLPPPSVLPNAADIGTVPYVMVGDEAFPLQVNLMRPYPVGRRAVNESQLVYNYRLSRARRIVENTFGILASRWRIYHTTIALQPANLLPVVLATIRVQKPSVPSLDYLSGFFQSPS